MRNTKKIVLLAVLTSLAVILSLIDKMITPLAFPALPTAKIGLANIIVLIGIYNFSFKEVSAMVAIKIVIANLLFGSLTSLIIGGLASSSSFLVMAGLYKALRKQMTAVGISVMGGFVHIVVQLMVTMVLYQLGEVVMYFGAILVSISLVSSILIGLIVNRLIDYLQTQKEMEAD